MHKSWILSCLGSLGKRKKKFEGNLKAAFDKIIEPIESQCLPSSIKKTSPYESSVKAVPSKPDENASNSPNQSKKKKKRINRKKHTKRLNNNKHLTTLVVQKQKIQTKP